MASAVDPVKAGVLRRAVVTRCSSACAKGASPSSVHTQPRRTPCSFSRRTSSAAASWEASSASSSNALRRRVSLSELILGQHDGSKGRVPDCAWSRSFGTELARTALDGVQRLTADAGKIEDGDDVFRPLGGLQLAGEKAADPDRRSRELGSSGHKTAAGATIAPRL